MKVPLFDLTAYHARLRERIAEAWLRVYDSGVFISGSEGERFEKELAERVGLPEVVGVSSGTDALVAALLALGVGSGDEVVTTPFSFMATASAIRAVGARVRFADVEADGFGIDPERVAAALGPKTRAVVPVHLFGEACAVDRIVELCRAARVAVVEDAAQALGARFLGRALGGFGDAGCFSFFPAKLLGALGDAGGVATANPELAVRLRRIRVHGAVRKHEHLEYGGNFRLDELQAAVLRVKLHDLGNRIESHRRHARLYDAAFAELPDVVVPVPRAGSEPSRSVYTLRVLSRRDELREALQRDGIQTQVHYPVALHLQPALAELGYAAGDFPNAEQRSREALSLPLFAELGDQQRDHVIDRVRAFFA